MLLLRILFQEEVMDISTEDKIQTTIYLPRSMHTELRIQALKKHISMTKLIKQAILRELQSAEEHKINQEQTNERD